MPLERSIGPNLRLDFLPGSVSYDPLVGTHPDAITASKIRKREGSSRCRSTSDRATGHTRAS